MDLPDKIKNEGFDPNDTGQIDGLKLFIDSSSDESKICEAYEYLGKIGAKNDLEELTNYFIDRYLKEKNDMIKRSIHTAIYWQKKTANTNLRPLIAILKKYKKRSLVEPIVDLLYNATHPEAEDALIHVLENDYGDWITIKAHVGFHTSGTRKCIPYLAKKLDHKSNDVSGSAFLALIRHADQRESELFIHELKNGKAKDTAMEGICLHCGIEAVDAVIERLKAKTSRPRKSDCNTYYFSDNENDVTIGLKFLNRFKNERKEISDLYHYLLNKRADKLFDYELDALKELINSTDTAGTLKRRHGTI